MYTSSYSIIFFFPSISLNYLRMQFVRTLLGMFDANNQSIKYLLKFFWPHISHELKNLRTMKDGGIFIYPLSICYPYKDNSERKYYTNICCKSASIPNLSNSFEPISSFVTARGLHCVYQITSN